MFLGFLLIALTWAPASAADTPSFESLATVGNLNEEIAAARESAPQDATYFYNLGTLLLRSGQIGPSVAYLEKARGLNPIDPAISKNLDAGRASLGQVLGEGRLDPASNLLERWSDRTPLKVIQGLLGLLLAIWAWFLARRHSTRDSRKGFGLAWGQAFYPGLILFLLISALRAGWWVESAAMVLEPQVIRSGPGNQFMDLGRAEAGVKLRASGDTRFEGESGKSLSWSQVRYSSDGIGWVKTSALLLL